MIDQTEERRSKFNKSMSKMPHALESLVTAAKQGDQEAGDQLCAALAWVAFSCPEAISQVYDVVMANWLETEIAALNPPVHALDLSGFDKAPIPDALKQAFWSLIDDADKGYDATSLTLRAADLGSYLDRSFDALSEQASAVHVGCTDAASRELPELYSVEKLSNSTPGSLVNDLYRMWVDNNFDPEVLDRDAIGLNQLKPHKRYLNMRILQMHDVWHLVAGYRTTGLHEIAISSFQLAQFGHNYSANFLAAILMMVHVRQPEGFLIIMQVVAEAWKHGRETPSMMDVEWQDIWHKSISEVRSYTDIKPFQSAIVADLFETAA